MTARQRRPLRNGVGSPRRRAGSRVDVRIEDKEKAALMRGFFLLSAWGGASA